MKQLFTILFSLLAIVAFSQDVTNQLGASNGTSSFRINNASGDSAFVIYDNGSIIGLGSMRMPIKLINEDNIDGQRNYDVTTVDYTLLVDASGGDITITFPVDLQISGPIINVKRVDEANNRNVTLVAGTHTVTFSAGKEGAVLQYFIDPAGTYTGWWVIAEIGTVAEPTGIE